VQELLEALAKAPAGQPPIVCIYGSDPDEANVILSQILERIASGGDAEVTYYTGESDEVETFHANVFHPPLFATTRILVHKKAELFKNVYNKSNQSFWESSWRRLPDHTYVVLLLNGELSTDYAKVFGDRLISYKVKPLYANQILHEILSTVKANQLSIQDDALQELRERLPVQSGAIHRTILKFKERFPDKERIELVDLQDILYPGSTLNIFRLVEAMFEHDLHKVSLELLNYNPATDDFFAILKIVLNRLNQIRRLKIGQSQKMGSDELANLVGLKGSPYFKKRLLGELVTAGSRLDTARLERLYQALIDLQISFRTQAAQRHQSLLFDRKVLLEFV